MGNTRTKIIAGAVLMSLGLMGASAAMSTDVYGGGATLPAGAYVGFNFGTGILSSNVAGSTAAAVSTTSLFGNWAATSGNALSYCQTGSGNGKKIFDHFDGTNVLPGATGACNGLSTGGFGAPSSVIVDPHFAASDAPMSQDEFNWFGLPAPGKKTKYTQPVQFPAVIGSVAIGFNNPDVSGALKLTDGAICRIFSGAVTNWSQLSTAETGQAAVLPSRSLTVVYRADGSGTSFSLANHLTSSACSATNSATTHFIADQSFAKVVSQFLPTLPANWNGQSGNPAVSAKVDSTPGAIGYAEAANLKSGGYANVKAAQVNGFDPYEGLPDSILVSTVTDRVITGVNATSGVAVTGALSPAATTPGCMILVEPSSYATSTSRYPIIAVSNLIANATGNGADVTAVRGLIGSAYASHTGVTTIGNPAGTNADGTPNGTGYAYVTTLATAGIPAKVNSCIN
jgi:ABC-type phosphate transport system substrate-binding protein